MKRLIGIGVVVFAFLCLVWGCVPQVLSAKPVSQTVPRSAVVEIRLLKAPGLSVAGSKWEIDYEFRMTNQTSLWTEREKFKDMSKERVGDLIKQGTVRSSLETPGAKAPLDIPFTAAALAKLKSQPTNRIDIGSVPPDNLKRNQEQEFKSQVFLFYSVVSIYDAKLKKTLTIPVYRVWDFVDFPDARFEIKVEIKDDGSYSVKSSLPKNATGRQLEIRQ